MIEDQILAVCINCDEPHQLDAVENNIQLWSPKWTYKRYYHFLSLTELIVNNQRQSDFYMPKSVFLPPLEKVVFFDMETEGLIPFSCKIITIQIRIHGKTIIWKEWELGEKGCIEAFFEFLESINRIETSMVGYNVIKFDISFLDQRLRELKMLDEQKWCLIHSWVHWIDLYQFLGNAYYKARDWYSLLAGKKYEVANVEIPELYRHGNYDMILSYIEEEMKGMEAVYQGLKKEKFYSELTSLRRKIMT
jgi:hypothetical protein